MSDPLVYDYAGSIKSPDELGLDDNGTWHSVMRNLNGLEAYVKILTSGQRGNIGRVPNAAKQMVGMAVQWEIAILWTPTANVPQVKEEKNNYIHMLIINQVVLFIHFEELVQELCQV